MCAVLLTATSDAFATRVKVRGATRISAHALRGRVIPFPNGANGGAQNALDGGTAVDTPVRRALFVEGTLEDDVGNRIANERVEMTVAGASDGRKVRLDGEQGMGTTCETPPLPLQNVSPETLVTTTDSSGRFCARLVLPAERYLVTIVSRGGPLLDPATAELGSDLVRRSVALRFDGAPRKVSLDKEEHAFVGIASFEDEDIRVAADLLPLTLITENGIILGTEVTGSGGVATFHVPSRALGEPGQGELRLQFPGDEGTSSASTSLAIEKHAKVTLALAQPVEPTNSPEDGVPIAVTVSSRAFAPPNGAVEARLGDTIVGAAPVRDGRATFSASFAAPERQEVSLTVRFSPEAPWWEAPEALGVRVPLVSAPSWRKLPLLAATALVALFVALGRVARLRSTPRAPKSVRAPPLREGISVLEVARDGRSGWTGRVVDAHERSPVSGVRVLIETSDFQGTQVMASAFGADDGTFTLPAVRVAGRAHLVVDAPLHTSLRKPLPSPGVLEIAVISRKRALLDRLVEWARMKGRPFDQKPEPTPGHVRRAAPGGSPPARWAEAVESAAFGPEPVDGRIEAEIDAMKPEGPPAAALPSKVGQTKEA
jgi:hypothetical protein